jgi:hypothetical protein
MPETTDDVIVCRADGSWYVRRVVLMFLMFAFFAGWFYKDYRWGYPEKMARYEEYKRVIAQPGGQEAWRKLTAERKWDAAPPDEKTQKDIEGQKHWAIGCGAAALAVLGLFAFNRRRTLGADATSIHATDGRRIPFSSVFRVDRRKWKHKGLSFVHYRDESGTERRAVIDDLKYTGADKVLDRLMANFSGEVIDLEDVETSTSEIAGAPPSPATVEPAPQPANPTPSANPGSER